MSYLSSHLLFLIHSISSLDEKVINKEALAFREQLIEDGYIPMTTFPSISQHAPLLQRRLPSNLVPFVDRFWKYEMLQEIAPPPELAEASDFERTVSEANPLLNPAIQEVIDVYPRPPVKEE